MTSELAIIIPAYKPTFLRETLESIANQTDKRFNLYIGDDCSPYDIKSVVDDFRDCIPTLRYHRFDTNVGGKDLVAQWERCIALSHNEPYIWLFSDDDVMDINCVETFYQLPQTVRKNALIHFNIRIIDSTKHDNTIEPYPFPAHLSVKEFIEGKRLNLTSFVVEFIFPRDIYINTGRFVNFDMAWGSDFLTWVKFASEAKFGIVTLFNAKVSWRKSNENISPDNSKPIIKRKIISLIYNAAFMKQILVLNSEKFDGLKPNFDLLKFPLGQLARHRHLFSLKECLYFTKKYIAEVGYIIPTIIATLYILSTNLIRRQHA